MKKILLLFLLLCTNSPVLADIQPPQWSEFCNPRYIHAEHQEYKKRNPIVKQLAYIGQICTLNIVPFYWNIITSDNKVWANNYWVERKEQFENEINMCKQSRDNDNSISCYMNIRQLELSKNAQLKNEAIAEENQRLQRIQLLQQIQMNNNIRNMNYNLNAPRTYYVKSNGYGNYYINKY